MQTTQQGSPAIAVATAIIAAAAGGIAIGLAGGDSWQRIQLQKYSEDLAGQTTEIETLKATQSKRLSAVRDFCKHYED